MTRVVIRASSLPSYPDCPRRWAARSARKMVEASGFDLRQVAGSNIGASVGTSVHAGASTMLAEKMMTGRLCPDTIAVDAAVHAFEEIRAEDEIMWDGTSPDANVATRQIQRMVRMYRQSLAEKLEPVSVEERLEADLGDEFVLSGQKDSKTAEPGRVRDLKTGTRRRAVHAQLGGYALLERSHGADVDEICEDYLARVRIAKEQPPVVTYDMDVAAAETAAMRIIQKIKANVRVFRETGDPWSFVANPESALCSDRWCPAHGTRFCREWRQDDPRQDVPDHLI